MSLKTVRDLRNARAFHQRRVRKLDDLAKDPANTFEVRYSAVVMAEEFREHIDKIDARLQQLKAQTNG